MAAIIKDLGAVTAYAYAVEQGYTGAEEEFAELMASYADVAEDAAESAAAAEQSKEDAVTAKTAAEAAAATATTKASAAATSADAASSSASTATTAATTATTKAGEATTAATTATTKATEAAASASTATTAASEAADSADAAAVSEEQAEEAADYIVTHAERLDGIEEEIYKVYPTETASGDIVSFTDGAEDIPVKALSVAVEPVQAGSGDPSPDNVRAITGWDAVNVVRCGVNIWDGKTEQGMIGSNGADAGSSTASRAVGYIPVVGGEAYYCKSATATAVNARFYDASKNHLSNAGIVNAVFTVPAGAKFMRFYCNEYPYTNGISINYPSTDHDLHAYVGTTYPIPLPSTVYGGTLDVASGVMTVDTMFYETTWGATTSKTTLGSYVRGAYNNRVKGNYPNYNRTPICNLAKYSAKFSEDSLHFYVNSVANGDNVFVFLPVGTPDSTVIQIAYELAEPYTITINPTTISTLLGNNTLYADAGQVSVAYRADVGLYIDKRIAEVQALVLES